MSTKLTYTTGPAPSVWYDDGDMCAEVFSNLAGSIDAGDMARLFAAAPDLLAALKAVEHTNGYCPWCYATAPKHKPDCPRQLAIAKVTMAQASNKVAHCPECDAEYGDYDGKGITYCPACGYWHMDAIE